MRKPLGVGIIGTGLMGGIHAECYATEPGAEVVALYNRTPEKAQALAKKVGGDVCTSLQELLAHPRVEAVSICSNQQTHAEQVIAAAHAGKHIMCEKPLALNPAEFKAMEQAVQKAGVTVMVGHQLRFHPIVRWMQQQMPRLGKVFYLELEMCFYISAAGGRVWEDYRSGGFFMELGCHLVDLARGLMGEVRHVTGHTLRILPERVTEDFTKCILQFDSGAIGSIHVSANHRTKRQGLLQGRLLGSAGRIEFSIYPYQRANNNATLIFDGGKSIFVPDVKIEKFPVETLPPSPVSVYKGFFDVYQQEIHNFVTAVRSGKAPAVTFADGRAAVEMVLAAYASQGSISDQPNFSAGLKKYRADGACHPLLASNTAGRQATKPARPARKS